MDGLKNTLSRVRRDGLPVRIVLSWIAFLGFMFNYGLRSSLSLAIVAMVNYSAIPHVEGPRAAETCWPADSNANAVIVGDSNNNSTNASLILGNNSELVVAQSPRRHSDHKEDGPFTWDESIQQLTISSFFWGYIILQIPGGRWAEVYGAKRLISVSLLGSAFFTLTVPVAAHRGGYVALIVVRALMGLFQAMSYPALTVLIARWAPPSERSRMNSFIKTGSMFGVFAVMPTAGWLIDSYGWESVFYFTGAMTVVWCAAWELLVYDSPDAHPRISDRERVYITQGLGRHNVGDKEEMKKRKVPWRSILTSVPMWAATSVSCFYGWTFIVMLSMTPTYLKVMLGFDIKTSALLTGLPYLGRVIFALGYSWAADYALKNRWASSTSIRKFSTAVTGVPRAVGLLVVSFINCDAATIVTIFIVTGILNGAASSAITPGLMEMSPNYVGTLYGIFNMGFTVAAIVGPVISAYIIRGQQTFETWATVFRLAAGLTLVSCAFYCAVGTAEEQAWNRYDERKSEARTAAAADEVSAEDIVVYETSDVVEGGESAVVVAAAAAAAGREDGGGLSSSSSLQDTAVAVAKEEEGHPETDHQRRRKLPREDPEDPLP